MCTATGSKWQSQDSSEVCIPAERQLLTLCHWASETCRTRGGSSAAGALSGVGAASWLASPVPAYLQMKRQRLECPRGGGDVVTGSTREPGDRVVCIGACSGVRAAGGLASHEDKDNGGRICLGHSLQFSQLHQKVRNCIQWLLFLSHKRSSEVRSPELVWRP